jgi:hypothetical protein
MSSFNDRLRVGEEFEDIVATVLEQRGIFYERLGRQGRTDDFNRLASYDNSGAAALCRFMPDFYVEGQPSALFDVKRSVTDSPNNALEVKAWNLYKKISKTFDADIYLIINDGHVYDVNNLNPFKVLYPDRGGTRGSSTPFVLFKKYKGVPFSEFFSESRWQSE